MEGFGLSVELFVILFSFLCWLVTPPKSGDFKVVEDQKTKARYLDLSPIFEEEEEVTSIELPVTRTGRPYELQEKIKKTVEVRISDLKVIQVREIAGILGLSLRNGRKRATKHQLVETIKSFLNSVELPESKILQIQQYF